MAVIAPVETKYDQGRSGIAKLITWADVTEADSFGRYIAPALSDGCFSVDGTFGGATITLHGSNAPTDANFTALKDIFDTAISIATNAGKQQIAENPLQYKPVRTGGSSTVLTVRLLLYGR